MSNLIELILYVQPDTEESKSIYESRCDLEPESEHLEPEHLHPEEPELNIQNQ